MSDESSVEISSDDNRNAKKAKPKKDPKTGGKFGANKRRSESSDEQVSDSEENDSVQDDDTSREWDEYCFVCQDGGNVICCDGCTNVAHYTCLKMKSKP